jgi:hypothetical protein
VRRRIAVDPGGHAWGRRLAEGRIGRLISIPEVLPAQGSDFTTSFHAAPH